MKAQLGFSCKSKPFGESQGIRYRPGALEQAMLTRFVDSSMCVELTSDKLFRSKQMVPLYKVVASTDKKQLQCQWSTRQERNGIFIRLNYLQFNNPKMTQTNSFHHEKVHTFHKMKALALENFTTILQFTAGLNPRNDTISNNRGSQFVNKNIDGENLYIYTPGEREYFAVKVRKFRFKICKLRLGPICDHFPQYIKRKLTEDCLNLEEAIL